MRTLVQIYREHALGESWGSLTEAQRLGRARDLGAALDAAGFEREAADVRRVLRKRGAVCCHEGCWDPVAGTQCECQAHVNLRSKRSGDDDFPNVELADAMSPGGLHWRFVGED